MNFPTSVYAVFTLILTAGAVFLVIMITQAPDPIIGGFIALFAIAMIVLSGFMIAATIEMARLSRRR